MTNMKNLLKLLIAISLSTAATSSVVSCAKSSQQPGPGPSPSENIFEADYFPPLRANFGWGKLIIQKIEMGNGYLFYWKNQQLGRITCIILSENTVAVSKIDNFLNVKPGTRPSMMQKLLDKIKISFNKEFVPPDKEYKGREYLVDKIEIS